MLDKTAIINALNNANKMFESEQIGIPDGISDEEILDKMSKMSKRCAELDRSIEDLTNIKEELDRAFSSEIVDLQNEYDDLLYKRHELFRYLYETHRKRDET